MTERTIRNHAKRSGLQLIKGRGGTVWLLTRKGCVIAICESKAAVAAKLGLAA